MDTLPQPSENNSNASNKQHEGWQQYHDSSQQQNRKQQQDHQHSMTVHRHYIVVCYVLGTKHIGLKHIAE